jgi:hypothetical protein
MNTERKKEQLNKVSYETFEIVMDRMEKEWFDLVCHITLDMYVYMALKRLFSDQKHTQARLRYALGRFDMCNL